MLSYLSGGVLMETKKLIVTDLDGTALQNWETLDPNTKEALIAAKES